MSLFVRAEFQEGERVVFSARDRSIVNVRRASADGGPLGFTSMELLMIAFGNCTLGTLMGQDAMKEAEIGRVVADITGEMQEEPARIASLVANIRVETTDPEALAAKLPELEAAVCRCPSCNSLNADKQIRLSIAGPSLLGQPEAPAIEGNAIACALPA